MARQSKKIREKGKLKLSSYFKKVEDGADVAIVTDGGVRACHSRRLQGKSGKVLGSRGRFKLVEIKDGGKMKKLIIHPVHLRKL